MAKRKRKERTELTPVQKDTQEYGLEALMAPDAAEIEEARQHSQYRLSEDELCDSKDRVDESEHNK